MFKKIVRKHNDYFALVYELHDSEFVCDIFPISNNHRIHIIASIIKTYRDRCLPWAHNVAAAYLYYYEACGHYLSIRILQDDCIKIVQAYPSLNYEKYFECILRQLKYFKYGAHSHICSIINFILTE